MKCDKCGSNLDIDTPYCPFCGSKNKIASKHREDMKRYEHDYKATKEEVIRNTKKFNIKNFRITMVAVTVAMIAAVIFICVFNENLAHNMYFRKCEKETVNYIPQIKSLVKQQDYMGLNDLINANNLKLYSAKEIPDYSKAGIVSEAYTRILGGALSIACAPQNVTTYTISQLGTDVQTIIKYSFETTNEPDVNSFYMAALRDTKAILTEILEVPEDKANSIETLSQANINLIIEEAYNAKLKK